MQLPALVEKLRSCLGIQYKQDIQLAARYFHPKDSKNIILMGDDCAAIPQEDHYLLLAAEGMLPSLVTAEPWFAGWCAVMVNVSDIYAMGGVPFAIVDTIWTSSLAEELWAGMRDAAEAYGVSIVGGHTNCHSPYTALSVAILGKSQHLITSFHARPGDILLMAIDLRGQPFKHYPFWNAATSAPPQRLRDDLALLPRIAERGLCRAGKDISMGGVLGTALMLLETSGCGAEIDLEAIPNPGLDLLSWLQHFPSYGFLLSVAPWYAPLIEAEFSARDICCQAIGTVNDSSAVTLKLGAEIDTLWDLAQNPLTGWGKLYVNKGDKYE